MDSSRSSYLGKRIRLLISKIFEVKTDLALFSNHNFSGMALCILENGNDACYVCMLLTGFFVKVNLQRASPIHEIS